LDSLDAEGFAGFFVNPDKYRIDNTLSSAG
jgi:hypothetical protein